MIYSVRSRRRLRPHTGELMPSQVAASEAIPQAPLAEGSSATKVLPIKGPVIERITMRARRDTNNR
ncbi:MAG: hypothetical protein H0T46_18775 [Deltaproteobacteria bacterium]|nr:hypothetical protein [Deltaproteobacteria bacterium]